MTSVPCFSPMSQLFPDVSEVCILSIVFLISFLVFLVSFLVLPIVLILASMNLKPNYLVLVPSRENPPCSSVDNTSYTFIGPVYCEHALFDGSCLLDLVQEQTYKNPPKSC
jgi:hypothetical protein